MYEKVLLIFITLHNKNKNKNILLKTWLNTKFNSKIDFKLCLLYYIKSALDLIRKHPVGYVLFKTSKLKHDR